MSAKQNKRYPTIIIDPIEHSPEVIAQNIVLDPIEDVNGEFPFQTTKVHIQDPKNPNKVGDLVLRFDRCLSMGINATKYKSTEKDWKNANMFTVLYNKNEQGQTSPTPRQKAVVETINLISEKCIDYLFKNKSQIMSALGNNPRIQKSDSKFQELNPVKWTYNDDGTPNEEKGPTLTIKLIGYKPKKDGKGDDEMINEETGEPIEDEIKINTKFFLKSINAAGKVEFPEINPRDYENQRCMMSAFVKVESIFINAKTIKLQLKLKEVIMEIQESVARKNYFENFINDFSDTSSSSTVSTTTLESLDEHMEEAETNNDALDDALDSEFQQEPQVIEEPKAEPASAKTEKKKRKQPTV